MIVVAGLIARAVAFSPYAIHHPDEQIQYLEQAHRLVFGSGVVPWEYRLGMRSWLVPMLLAGPMWLGDRLVPGSLLYVLLPRLFCALLALAPLWAVYRIGGLLSRTHATVALAVVALWPESVYFSVHILTETLSAAAFLPAAALLLGRPGRWRIVVAGVLLGLSAILRIQYAPVAALLAILTLRRQWRHWGWLIAGGLAPVLASALVDLTMGQWPFAWVVNNLRFNIVENRAALFGVYGPVAYLQMLWLAWTVAIAPIVWLAWLGGRRLPVLALVAVVNVAIHLLIGHKEYRFILLSTQIAILLAAIGTVELANGVGGGRRAAALTAALSGWAALALVVALGDLSDPGWRRYAAGYQLAREAHRAGACGLAIFAGTTWPPVGQTFLHGTTPVYYFNGPSPGRERDLVAAAAPAFDAIVAPPGRASIPAAFQTRDCLGSPARERLCLAMRPGGCSQSRSAARLLMQHVMQENGY